MKNIAMLVSGTIALLGIEAGPATAFPAAPGVITKQTFAGEQIEPVHMRRHRHHHSYRRYYGNPYGYYGPTYAPPVYVPFAYGYFGGGHHFGGHHFGGHHFGGHHLGGHHGGHH